MFDFGSSAIPPRPEDDCKWSWPDPTNETIIQQQQRIAELEQSVDFYKSQKHMFSERCRELERELAALKDRNNRLGGVHIDLIGKYEKLKGDMDTLVERTATLRESAEFWAGIAKKANAELAALRGLVRELIDLWNLNEPYEVLAGPIDKLAAAVKED